MSEDHVDEKAVEQRIEELQAELNRISSDLRTLTADGDRKTALSSSEEKQLISLQGEVVEVVYQIGFVSNFFTGVKSRVLGATSAWKKFRQLVKTCTTLLSKYMSQLKLDSIAVTLSVPPSITVTLRP
jgi:negative regulator of sigma E activity